jgi:hypothetical protein
MAGSELDDADHTEDSGGPFLEATAGRQCHCTRHGIRGDLRGAPFDAVARPSLVQRCQAEQAVAGWVVRKSVAGAERTTTLDDPTKTLREAKAIADGDWKTGLL